MREILIFCIIAFNFITCKNSNDNLKSVQFGKESSNDFISRSVKEKLLSEPSEDSQSYRYYIAEDTSIFPVELIVNPDGYNFGKVRQIQLNLGGDSIYWFKEPAYSRAFGPRLKTEIDKIYDIYIKWYGKPDSINIEYKNKIDLSNLFKKNRAKEIDSTIYPQRTAYWNTQKFNLIFHLPFSEKNSHFDSAYTYDNYASIVYEMKDYKKIIFDIQDSIRKQLKPNDIISVSAWNPEWTNLNSNNYWDPDTYFKINLSEIKRIDREEPRSVTAIRFDIILYDNFGEVLCRLEEITFEPDEPLWTSLTGITSFKAETMIYSAKYSSSSKNAINLEKARKYAQQNSITPRADIKAIVFEDGSVLK